MSPITKKNGTAILLAIIAFSGLLFVHQTQYKTKVELEVCRTLPVTTRDTCADLLMDGNYNNLDGNETWQPYGCQMHYYSIEEAKECMRMKPFHGRSNIFSFVGDSRMRDLFRAFNQAVGFKGGVKKMHENSEFKDHVNGITSYFVWRPNVTSRLQDKIWAYSQWEQEIRPTMVVVGAGVWSILLGKGTREAHRNYARNLSSMVPAFQKLASGGTLVLWRMQYPVKYEKMKDWGKNITNDEISKYNHIANKILNDIVPVWWSSRYTAGKHMHDYGDGIHCGQKPSNMDAQILLNLYCNHKMNHANTTCCLEGMGLNNEDQQTSV